MSWKPFSLPHGREDTIEAARWLRDRLAGIPEPGNKWVIPQETRERVLRPQLDQVIAEWGITEAELLGPTGNAARDRGEPNPPQLGSD